ncbi:MAG: DNA topoisomerase III [Epulopiscium sp. Nele67-Bin004]|nr:MAG: DNA topoisomerase III [Epulopiscium sp. Nele67-Bin004]
MKVVIAEKPSVAKNIADALGIKKRQDGYFEGNGYYITWAFGHLLGLYDAKDYDEKMARWYMKNFPFIPEKFEYKAVNNSKKQLACIKKLINNKEVTEVVSACDYDREGQIIGDIILAHLKVKKPIYRILLNEWTEAEVLKGIENMVPNKQLKPLQDAGISRQQADWLIGINLTSVATLKYKTEKGQVYNIGRVLLPTLKMIYDRDIEIEKFDPKPYYKLVADFNVDDKKYRGTYIVDKKDQFDKRTELDLLQKQLIGQPSTIIDKTINHKKEYPFPLFNLSALQGYVTSKFKGWSSDKVLKVAQTLYEKKYITYPRTASTVLDDSLVGKTQKVLEVVKKGLPHEDEIVFKKLPRVFNSSKVESHSAIIPTYKKPNSLGFDEQIVYTAILNRFLMQFMPVAEHDETIIITEACNSEFITKGRIQKVLGWKKLENDQTKDVILPNLEKDDKGIVENAEVTAHTTKPPKPYTEKTLLRAMETCGKKFKDDDEEVAEEVLSGFSIGTPATRADTIKKLCSTNYTIMDKKNIRCTPKGRAIIEMFPVKELMDLQYTGKLEKTLADMEKGLVSKDEFMTHIKQFVVQAVDEIVQQQKIIQHVELKPATSATPQQKEVIGECPICGSNIVEGDRGFGCMGYKQGCKFVLWKQDDTFKKYNKKLTKTAAKALLKKGNTVIKGFKTPSNTKFEAIVSYEYDKESSSVKWKFDRT